MDYESFKEKFVEDLKDRLDEQGADVKVSVNTVNKLNESYEAVTVTPEGSNIGVNIGIDKFYDAMENGRSYDEVVDKAVEVVNSGITQRPDFDIDSLSDYSQMKEKLAMEVVSAEANKEMLETVPHQNMEDMAVVYRFVLSSDDDGRASILVTNQLLESMGVTPEQLHADAMENATLWLLRMRRSLLQRYPTRYTEPEFLLIRTSWIRQLKEQAETSTSYLRAFTRSSSFLITERWG